MAVRRRKASATAALDGDDAIEPAVVCLPHFAHASGADSFEQPIATQEVFVHRCKTVNRRSDIRDRDAFIETPSLVVERDCAGEVSRVGD